jgi:hypothetical protein
MLGPTGSTTNITIPYSSGRIWYSVGSSLTFLVNPSSAGVQFIEPSFTNSSDSNYNIRWDFCEFAYETTGVYANVTYVDFVSIPVALQLTNTSGVVTQVSGLPSDGLDKICASLIAQNSIDDAGWDQLIIKGSDGSNLRVLNPTYGIITSSSLFENYWTDYINQVWEKYVSTPLVVDTQSSWGIVTGNTSNDRSSINFGGIGSFSKPSAADIFSQDSGAFAPQANNTAEMLRISAIISTAINRSTLLTDSYQPDGETVSSYYTNPVTNHYARIVHAANLDGKGYCFPYDDVGGSNEKDQSGCVTDPSPKNLLVTIGGGNAVVRRNVEMEVSTTKEDYHYLVEKGEYQRLPDELVSVDMGVLKLSTALKRIWRKVLIVSFESLSPI